MLPSPPFAEWWLELWSIHLAIVPGDVHIRVRNREWFEGRIARSHWRCGRPEMQLMWSQSKIFTDTARSIRFQRAEMYNKKSVVSLKKPYYPSEMIWALYSVVNTSPDSLSCATQHFLYSLYWCVLESNFTLSIIVCSETAHMWKGNKEWWRGG